jgi:hypothetical protein
MSLAAAPGFAPNLAEPPQREARAAPPPLLQAVTLVTLRFAAGAGLGAATRFEAKVSSCDGLPMLCAVEAALSDGGLRPAAQELVWLSGAPRPGAHRLRLQAFGRDNTLLAEATHEFAA